MPLIFNNLVVLKTLSYNIIAMHNFIAKFRKVLEICKQYAGNFFLQNKASDTINLQQILKVEFVADSLFYRNMTARGHRLEAGTYYLSLIGTYSFCS